MKVFLVVTFLFFCGINVFSQKDWKLYSDTIITTDTILVVFQPPLDCENQENKILKIQSELNEFIEKKYDGAFKLVVGNDSLMLDNLTYRYKFEVVSDYLYGVGPKETKRSGDFYNFSHKLVFTDLVSGETNTKIIKSEFCDQLPYYRGFFRGINNEKWVTLIYP